MGYKAIEGREILGCWSSQDKSLFRNGCITFFGKLVLLNLPVSELLSLIQRHPFL